MTDPGHETPPSFDEKKSPVLRTVIFIGLAVLCGALVWWAAPPTDKKGGQKPDMAVPVQTATVKRESIAYYLSGIGSVQSPHAVTVRSRVDGELMQIHFREGQMVNAGDLLAEIDPRTIVATLNQAKAEKLRVEAQLNLARANLKRSQALRKVDAVSAQTLDQQQAEAKSLEAAVQSAQATIEANETQLTYTKITSPVSGRVGIRQVDPGNIVSANDANGIVSVVQIDPISVVFTLPQADLPKLSQLLNQENVPVDAFDKEGGNALAQGTLQVVDNQVDATTGTIRLKAIFENKANALWPGQLIVARLRESVQDDALVVPVSAIQRGIEGPFVFRIVEQIAQMTPVEIRSEDQKQAVIAKGLNENDIVVTDGQLRLKNSSKVKLAEQKSAEKTDEPQP